MDAGCCITVFLRARHKACGGSGPPTLAREGRSRVIFLLGCHPLIIPSLDCPAHNARLGDAGLLGQFRQKAGATVVNGECHFFHLYNPLFVVVHIIPYSYILVNTIFGRIRLNLVLDSPQFPSALASPLTARACGPWTPCEPPTVQPKQQQQPGAHYCKNP